MKKDIKKIWLKALRSGEYQKGKHSLHTNNGFCCLGVLTDLYRKRVSKKSHDKFWRISERSFINNTYACHLDGEREDAYLPEKVQDWAGIDSGTGRFYKKDGYGTPALLSSINDRTDTFEEVIEVIEEHF